jgi:predicted lipoprotein with Yx(FWY)xxD motif
METTMTRTRSRITRGGAALVVLAALVVAGCGGNSGTTGTTGTTDTHGHAATVGVASTGLGKVLVDSTGRTLYLFKADRRATSACSGACAAAWPPLRADGKPTLGAGLPSSLIRTTQRPDGKPQVTFDGHPLYHYVGDHKAGDTSGQGLNAFGAGWYALTASGAQASDARTGGAGADGY